MADTLRIGRNDVNDEATRVPSGDATEDGKVPREGIEKDDRAANCYRLQVFTPPAIDGDALWGTFGAEGNDETPAPPEAPTRRVRYVRSMRRPALAVATGAFAALVFLSSLWVYTRVRAPVGDSNAAPAVTPSPALAVSSVATAIPSPRAATETAGQAPAPASDTPGEQANPAPTPRPEPPTTRSAGRTSAPPSPAPSPAPSPDAGPPATATQPVPTPSGMMIPDPPY